MALKYFNPQLKALSKTPQRKTYTVLVVTVSIVVLMIFAAIRPAIVSIFDRLNENDEKRDLIAQMDTKYQALVNLNKQEQNFKEQLNLLESAFPGERKEEFVEINLAKMAEKRNLEVLSMNVNKSPTKSVIDEDVVKGKVGISYLYITLSGKRSDMLNFIEDIEDFPRVLNIVNYSYVPDEKNEDSVKVSFELEFYYYL